MAIRAYTVVLDEYVVVYYMSNNSGACYLVCYSSITITVGYIAVDVVDSSEAVYGHDVVNCKLAILIHTEEVELTSQLNAVCNNLGKDEVCCFIRRNGNALYINILNDNGSTLVGNQLVESRNLGSE